MMLDLEGVGDALCRQVEVTADDRSDLLVSWLNELIYVFEVDNMLFKRFDIGELSETRLRARCYGERIDPERHKINVGFKAATYHMLKIDEGDGFRVQVLFDT
jgi:SHS2 domain-containing protein